MQTRPPFTLAVMLLSDRYGIDLSPYGTLCFHELKYRTSVESEILFYPVQHKFTNYAKLELLLLLFYSPEQSYIKM